MTQEQCAKANCKWFRTNAEIRRLNRERSNGNEVFPLDVEWKNCLLGPDYWLNCRKRRKQKETEK